MNVKNKKVLVTGSGTGLGSGIALNLAKNGADVVIHYNQSKDSATKTFELVSSFNSKSTLVQADLTDVNSCKKLVDNAAEFLGGLDSIVNNSGITIPKHISLITEEHFTNVMNTNFRSYFFCSQAALPYLRKPPDQTANVPCHGSSIINISSVHAKLGCPGHSLYAATKGAINSFTTQLAIELLDDRIRVNCVAPGTIEVESYFEKNPKYSRAVGNSLVPWGRVGLPLEVGSLISFLVSDESEFMTGQTLYFDGGLTSKMAINL